MTTARAREGSGRALPANHDVLVRRIFPAFRALIRLGYFSLQVDGLEHVPREGRVVYAQNHSGWFPFDAAFLMFALYEAFGEDRLPYFATLEAALAAPGLGSFMRHAGALPASWFRRPERLPPEIDSVAIFPEGERGNTKPFWEAYRMRGWNRGFVRVAIARDAPIVPAAILGGEECVPVAWTVRILEPLIGSVIGLPLSPVPLPSRWRIVFHEPVHVAARGREALSDALFTTEVSRSVQATVQATLDRLSEAQPLGRLSALVAAASQPALPGEGIEDVEDPLDDASPPPRPPPTTDGAAAA